MCFHSKQSKDAQKLEKRYKVKLIQPELFKTGDFNGFEHPSCPVISNENYHVLQFSEWGLLPQWARDKSFQKNTLNAKLETINEKPTFKDCVTQRCILPVDGFYEWKWLDINGREKQKYLLHIEGYELFSLAGLWSKWTNPQTKETIHTFTILTTTANELMSEIHNSKKRMPVIIHPDTEQEWLSNGKLELYNDYLLADKLYAPNQQMGLWEA
jgi:putative SOS response-associated peptidase YedK